MKRSYYFPHDFHARYDPKLTKMRMEDGPVTDGIFWDLVEMLYEEGGYLHIKEIPLYAKMLNADEQMLNKVVTNLFLSDGQRFWNDSLLERLEHIKKVSEERREAGISSGKSRKTNICSTNAEHLRNNIKEKKINKIYNIYIPPSLEDVTKYCTERGNGVNPEAFINHYTAKGWLIGKTKMKDWRAAVRTWEQRNPPTNKRVYA